jgi:hypothetical protein
MAQKEGQWLDLVKTMTSLRVYRSVITLLVEELLVLREWFFSKKLVI